SHPAGMRPADESDGLLGADGRDLELVEVRRPGAVEYRHAWRRAVRCRRAVGRVVVEGDRVDALVEGHGNAAGPPVAPGPRVLEPEASRVPAVNRDVDRPRDDVGVVRVSGITLVV